MMQHCILWHVLQYIEVVLNVYTIYGYRQTVPRLETSVFIVTCLEKNTTKRRLL